LRPERLEMIIDPLYRFNWQRLGRRLYSCLMF